MAKRKVLIPLDGSEFSRQIVRVVQEFFDPREVSLVLLRVASAPSVPLDAPSARDMFGGAARAASIPSVRPRIAWCKRRRSRCCW